MAINTQTLQLVTLAQNYRGNIIRQINRSAVALGLLPWEADGGQNIAWAAEFSGAVAETFVDGADVSNAGSDAQKQALLPWGKYRSSFALSDLAAAAAATSGTPVGNLMLWQRNLSNGLGALASKMNADLYVAVSNGFEGFDKAVGLTNNIYAGIDRTVDTDWQPYVVDPGVLTAVTQDQIRLDLAEILKRCGMRPDLAFVSPAVYRAIGATFDPQKFYMYQTMTPPLASGMRPTLEGGVGAIMFDGCAFVEDKDATESQIHYINSLYTSIQYLDPLEYAMGLEADIKDTYALAAQVPVETTGPSLPLAMCVYALSRTGSAQKAMLQGFAQLRVKRPNSCGVRKNVAI